MREIRKLAYKFWGIQYLASRFQNRDEGESRVKNYPRKF